MPVNLNNLPNLTFQVFSRSKFPLKLDEVCLGNGFSANTTVTVN